MPGAAWGQLEVCKGGAGRRGVCVVVLVTRDKQYCGPGKQVPRPRCMGLISLVKTKGSEVIKVYRGKPDYTHPHKLSVKLSPVYEHSRRKSYRTPVARS